HDHSRLPRTFFAGGSSRCRDRRDLLALRRCHVDRRLHDGLHPLMRNPLRSETEAFRFLIAVIVGALVIVGAAYINTWLGVAAPRPSKPRLRSHGSCPATACPCAAKWVRTIPCWPWTTRCERSGPTRSSSPATRSSSTGSGSARRSPCRPPRARCGTGLP